MSEVHSQSLHTVRVGDRLRSLEVQTGHSGNAQGLVPTEGARICTGARNKSSSAHANRRNRRSGLSPASSLNWSGTIVGLSTSPLHNYINDIGSISIDFVIEVSVRARIRVVRASPKGPGLTRGGWMRTLLRCDPIFDQGRILIVEAGCLLCVPIRSPLNQGPFIASLAIAASDTQSIAERRFVPRRDPRNLKDVTVSIGGAPCR